MPNLYYLDVSSNRLQGKVPSLNEKSHLNALFIDSNYFKFSGIEQIAESKQRFVSLMYSPQLTVLFPKKTDTTIYIEHAGGTLANNTYRWFRDDYFVASITGDSSYKPQRSGFYTVRVTNAVATNLTLYSTSRYLTVADTLINNVIAAANSSPGLFKVYPNSAKNYVNVSFNAASNTVVKLSDMIGKVLQTQTPNTKGLPQLK